MSRKRTSTTDCLDCGAEKAYTPVRNQLGALIGWRCLDCDAKRNLTALDFYVNKDRWREERGGLVHPKAKGYPE